VEEILLSVFNVHNFSDFRQMEVHTLQPLVTDPSSLEFEIATTRLKNYISPGRNQIQAELVPAGGET
jgi:hypothetical protein